MGLTKEACFRKTHVKKVIEYFVALHSSWPTAMLFLVGSMHAVQLPEAWNSSSVLLAKCYMPPLFKLLLSSVVLSKHVLSMPA